MMRYAGRAVLCAVLVAALGRAASAQSATPSPVPTPSGFTAHSHANVNFVSSGNTLNAVGRFAVAQRGGLTRIDILSVSSDSFPLPPVTGSAVIDHTARTVTVWNDTTRLYYVQSFVPSVLGGRASPSPAPRPSATPRPSPRPRRSAPPRGSPFRDLQVLSVSLKMTGHTTTVGLPTTGLAFDLQVQGKNDRTPTHVTANTQLADDYAIFPVTFDASVEPGSGSFNMKVSYAVDDLTRTLPPTTAFTVPAGYTKASSLMGVFFPGRNVRPAPSSSAAPMVTPTPMASPTH
ncbi:MAG TPA: hypothetical protein VK669_08480 [Candidatus Limnocylindrales bacterium]|nr:hypothetical protein [Candidatus Limnocylindrales bacterium]